MPNPRSFGIYIKTFRPDYNLAKALIASLWEHAPGVEITLIPDDGYEKPDLLGLPAMVSQDPFAQRLQGYYKKLWVFFGPYERFVYLDADMLALAPLTAFLDQVQQAEEPFFYVCAETKFVDWLANGSSDETDRIYQQHIGDLDLLREFDPDYRPREAFPFNSGCFASHRDFFSPELIRNRFDAAEEFHASRGAKPLCFSRQGAFMGDQGFINYLVAKRGVKPHLMTDLWHWGGRSAPENLAQARGGADCRHLFVHWAGCPRPSLFSTGVPHQQEWRRRFREYHKQSSGAVAWWRQVLVQASQTCTHNAKHTLKKITTP